MFNQKYPNKNNNEQVHENPKTEQSIVSATNRSSSEKQAGLRNEPKSADVNKQKKKNDRDSPVVELVDIEGEINEISVIQVQANPNRSKTATASYGEASNANCRTSGPPSRRTTRGSSSPEYQDFMSDTEDIVIEETKPKVSDSQYIYFHLFVAFVNVHHL